LADIIDFLPDATFAIDLEGRVVTWNRAIEKMTGVHKVDMIGQGNKAYSVPFYGIRREMLLDRLTLDDEVIRKRHDSVSRKGNTLYAEAFCKGLNNGKGAYVWATATALFDDQGNRMGAIESIRDITDRKKMDLQVRERMKELRAFYSLAELAENKDLTLDELYQDLTNLLPNSWQYSEIACARITIGGKEFRTENFREPAQLQSAPIRVYGSNVGRVEIGYLEEKPELDEGPFLKEERLLIDAISERIGHITERKRAEEALRESIQRYELVMDGSSAGLWDSDVIHKRIHFSSHWKAMRGYTDTEIGDSQEEWTSRIHPDDAPRITAAMEAHLSGKTDIYEAEYRVRRKDGSFIWVLDRGKAVRNADGRVIRNVGSEIDITERKQAEEALRESESRMARLADQSRTIVWELDTNGFYTYIGPTCEAVLGYRPEEVVGKMYFYDLTPEPEREPLKELVFRVMRNKEQFIGLENPIRAKDGRIVMVSTNGIPLLDKDGILRGYQGSDMDITERKRAEDALKQANNKLGILSSITRHDINNQMMVLNGFLELSKHREKDPELAQFIEKMSHAAANIQEQITFAKDYQELGIKTPAWASVGRRITDAFASLHPTGISLEENTGGIEVLTDPLADKVPYNLVDNSMRHGGHVTHIKLRAEQVGDAMLIIYEDDGVGIGEDYRKHLFAKGFGKNTGYGLFLIREILAITGITIEERGQPGKGVRFEMLVPAGAWRRPTVKG
jgi:PAS domain S-box-containing protein